MERAQRIKQIQEKINALGLKHLSTFPPTCANVGRKRVSAQVDDNDYVLAIGDDELSSSLNNEMACYRREKSTPIVEHTGPLSSTHLGGDSLAQISTNVEAQLVGTPSTTDASTSIRVRGMTRGLGVRGLVEKHGKLPVHIAPKFVLLLVNMQGSLLAKLVYNFHGEIGDGVLISLDQWTPYRGNTILHAAAKSGKVQIMEIVLNSLSPHSPLYTTNFKGNTALHIAASLGDFYLSLLLITRAIYQGAEVKRLLLRAKNVEQDTALHLAVKHGHYDIVVLLITEDPGLTLITNDAGESPLFLAVDRGFFEIALRILEIQECSDEGRNNMNVLHAAVMCVEIYFVRKMLDKFPNAIMKANDFGWTPLHYAAYFGSLEVVKLFLENDNTSLAYERDKQGMSALHISAKRGHCDVMSAIIKKFPYTCELLDNRGRTALHLAAESGSTNAVKILLSSLAFQDLINEQENDEGNTAIHLAAIKSRYKVLELLAGDKRVEKGTTNKEGKTIVDIILLDKKFTWLEKISSMPEWWNRSRVLLSMKQEFERQTTEKQIAENVGHEQFQESQRIAPGKVEGGTGAANDADFKERNNYIVLVTTLITTVTFAAAFQVPGGYDDKGKPILLNNQQFKYFLICDSLAFGTSTASLFIYFGTPLLQRLTPAARHTIQRLAWFLSMVSLLSMLFAFPGGIAAVLDKKSSLNSIANSSVTFGWAVPLYMFFIIIYSYILPGFFLINKIRRLIS
nr:ankyrin repeat-containing protein itn1 [Quercus suber]